MRASAATLSEEIRQGIVSAASLTKRYLDAIASLDGELHAFLTVMAEDAARQAARVDRLVSMGQDPGPLAGIPIAIKDNLCTRGVPTTCASRILQGWRPPYNATVVEKLERAGAVIVGKTNMDEFAMGSSTENSAFGVTRNPYNTGRVPGGSSGGSAAAVASGLSMVALGSDTGGSIRQPAALCGVVGMKPTYGMVSRYGLVAFASSLDQIGPFGGSVADVALVYSVIAGHDPRDSTCLRTYRDARTGLLQLDTDGLAGYGASGAHAGENGFGFQEDAAVLSAADGSRSDFLAGLRVGLLKEITHEVAPDVRRRVEEAAAALASFGAAVEEVSIPELHYALGAYYLIAPAEASSNLARYDGIRYGLRVDGEDVTTMMSKTRAAGFGPEVKRRIMLGTYALSAGYYDAYYGQAQRVRAVLVDAFASVYRNYDVLIGATTPTTAFGVGEKADDPLAMYLSDVCTIPSNLAGHPAVSVPFGTGDDGLPVGVQVLAPALGESVMFRVAAAIESAAPPLPAPSVLFNGGMAGEAGTGADVIGMGD
ncbi:MAG: amidase family protein [Acidimicrobiales bacterium]